MKFRDILLALCAPLLLGFGFAIAKPAMQQFPPFLLMGLRFTITALFLIWWFPIPKGLLKDLFIVSLIGGTLTYGLVYLGLIKLMHLQLNTSCSSRSTFWSNYCIFSI